MSGGSYNYIYLSLENECVGRMHDEEMNDMIEDLCNVLHELEWWQSNDASKESYRKCVSEFKAKWFNGDREERIKGYVDKQINLVRAELYKMIGYELKEQNNG